MGSSSLVLKLCLFNHSTSPRAGEREKERETGGGDDGGASSIFQGSLRNAFFVVETNPLPLKPTSPQVCSSARQSQLSEKCFFKHRGDSVWTSFKITSITVSEGSHVEKQADWSQSSDREMKTFFHLSHWFMVPGLPKTNVLFHGHRGTPWNGNLSSQQKVTYKDSMK